MKIIASSAIGAAGAFLHAGYISGAPADSSTLLELLSCGSSVTDGMVALSESGNAAASLAAGTGHTFAMMVGVVCFAGLLAGAYLFQGLRRVMRPKPG